MYILECANQGYYVGSTTNLRRRLKQHKEGGGARYTQKFLPVKLVYFEEFDRIDTAFYREKQVQGWSRVKKKALIDQKKKNLPELAKNRVGVLKDHSDTICSGKSLNERSGG